MSKIVLKGSGTDLAVLEVLSPADLFAKGGTEPVFEAIATGQVPHTKISY